MPLVLRKIRKTRWDKELIKQEKWLGPEEIPSDPLGDLTTTNNQVSIWELDESKSNLDRLIAAIASNGDHVANFDFVIFSIDHRTIEEMGIELSRSIGKCPDKEIANFHRDMGKFSGSKLVNFVKWILENGETERYQVKKVSKLIANSIQNGFIKKDDLKDSIYVKVRPLLNN
jgi:hypothetical protein